MENLEITKIEITKEDDTNWVAELTINNFILTVKSADNEFSLSSNSDDYSSTKELDDLESYLCRNFCELNLLSLEEFKQTNKV